jgi:hypothetical protein
MAQDDWDWSLGDIFRYSEPVNFPEFNDLFDLETGANDARQLVSTDQDEPSWLRPLEEHSFSPPDGGVSHGGTGGTGSNDEHSAEGGLLMAR